MSRAYCHVNRMGDAYYLQAKTEKLGQMKYSFARKLTGSPVEHLPAGYEVRESPESGQVVIRRFKPSAIRPEEKELLEKTIREQTDDVLFIVDVEDKAMIVYTSDMDADVRIDLLRQIVPMDAATAKSMKADMLANARFVKTMRFTLVDAEHRQFKMERWCFKGSIDDWYFIDGDMPLPDLARKYVQHLGKDSFFDLM